jgi:hypothetical protein
MGLTVERTIKIKPSLALLAIALLSLGATACGGASKAGSSTTNQVSPNASTTGGASTTSASSGAPTGLQGKDSNDGDNDPQSNDDTAILDYGHLASAADKRAVTALVKRYYAAAAAANGTRACPLIYGIVVETIPEEFAGDPRLRGKTCATVMSKVFKQRHRQMAADNAILKVTRVGVEGDKGLVLIYLGIPPVSSVLVHREGRAWKMQSLFEGGIP